MGDLLDGLSLAEWEYANRFFDYMDIGEPKPDADGFDPERIREIERRIREAFRQTRDATYGNLRI